MTWISLYLARRRLDRLQQDKLQLAAQARAQLDGLDAAIAITKHRVAALECGVTESSLDVQSIARSVARR